MNIKKIKFVNYYFAHAVNIKNNVIFELIIYEIIYEKNPKDLITN